MAGGLRPDQARLIGYPRCGDTRRGAMSDVVYRLNDWDEITFVNEEWSSFARTNLGPENR